MIEVINYQNETVEKPLQAEITKSYDEARELLPPLPETIQIYFSDYGIMPETGVGGYAYAHDIITLSLDPNFKNKAKQSANIRPTIFHEAFHVAQGFTGEDGPFSAIENALYEGMATAFEREHAGVLEPYGDYAQLPEEKMEQWLRELQKLDANAFAKEEVYSKWKFYHPEYNERWIVYRIGTWLVDQVLEKQSVTILDLCDKTAAEVLALL